MTTRATHFVPGIPCASGAPSLSRRRVGIDVAVAFAVLSLVAATPAAGVIFYQTGVGFRQPEFFIYHGDALAPIPIDLPFGSCSSPGTPDFICGKLVSIAGNNGGRLFLKSTARFKRTNAAANRPETAAYADTRITITSMAGYVGTAPGAAFYFGLSGVRSATTTNANVNIQAFAVATLYAGTNASVQCVADFDCIPKPDPYVAKVHNWNPSQGFLLILRSDVAAVAPFGTPGGWDAEVVAEFGDTLELLAIQLLDANDDPIPGVTLTALDANGDPEITFPNQPPTATATPTPTLTPTPTPTLTPLPSERTVISYFLPKSLKLKLAGAGKDTLTAGGSFDDGNLPADLSQPVTIEVGDWSRTVTLTAKGADAFAFKDATLSLAVKTHLKGSSRGAFKLRVGKATLAGLIAPVGTVELHFHASGLPDALGIVTLTNGAFALDKVRGDLVAPAFFPSKASVAANDTKPDALSFSGGFGNAGPTPAVLGDVHIALGDTFDQTIAGSTFTRKGNVFSHSEKGAGTTLSVSLDFGRGTMKVKAKGYEVGTFSAVTADFVVDLGDGALPVRTTVRLGGAGAKRVY